MPDPSAALQALRASTADLLAGLENAGWSDADLAAPSLCAGWTRGHVLAHVARNADGIAGTLSGALRGEIVEQYPGGRARRDADIDDGAARPLAAQLGDLTESAARLDRVFSAVHDADGWSLPTDRDLRAEDWPFHRLREVEVHRVDLAGAYGPDCWPPLLVSELLPVVAATLDDRTSGAVRVTVAAEGSVVAELAGRTWTVGAGDPVEVRAPDWAVLAWLTGRHTSAGATLGAAPALAPWR